MSDKQEDRIETIFYEVLDQPHDQRAAFIEQACSEDDLFKSEVLSLLKAHEQSEGFLARNAIQEQADAEAIADPMLGRDIGPYRVLRRIAIGGMGSVYLADRADRSFDKQVAIKVIRTGMMDTCIITRFRNERQVLANLDHPNIARLLDGGETDDGRPYLVMEYVEGMRLDHYADEHRLSIDERLDLFLTVCDAVQFAHRNLVIHRDLKPSNILVTVDGQVKLLDFGIAKVLTPEQESSLDVTATIQRQLTPAYASPEQIRGEAITTAMDVYSLGVILYELLTGRWPYLTEGTTFERASRVIVEEVPTRPSDVVVRAVDAAVRMSTGDESQSAASIAALRKLDPARLRRMLRGDLENIVLMALRKEPDRRYTTIEQFGNDILSYRKSLPIIARPDTMRYRMKKFIARNRAMVAAGVLLLAVLSSATVISTRAYVQAAVERDRAQLAEHRAERRFAEVRELANTMLFDVYDDVRSLPGSTGTSRQIVETASRYLRGLMSEAGDDAELMLDIASAYRRLGDIQGGMMGNPGLGDLKGADESYSTGLAIVQQVREHTGETDSLRIVSAALHLGIGHYMTELGQLDDAIAAYRTGLATRLNVESTDQADAFPTKIDFIGGMARLHARFGDYDTALQLTDETIEFAQRQWEQEPDSARRNNDLGTALFRMAELLQDAGQFERAIDVAAQGSERFERARHLDPSNRNYRRMHNNCEALRGRMMARSGNLAGGIALKESLLDEQHAMILSDPLDRTLLNDLAVSHRFLGEFKVMMQEPQQALEHYSRAVELRQRLAEIDITNVKVQRDLAATIDMQATALWRVGRYDEAMQQHLEARHVFERLAAQHTEDADLLRSVSVSDFNLGELMSALAKQDAVDAASRNKRLRSAIDHYQSSLDVLLQMRDSGRLRRGDESAISMIELRISSVIDSLDEPSETES